jgi:hypothetical protein
MLQHVCPRNHKKCETEAVTSHRHMLQQGHEVGDGENRKLERGVVSNV